MTDRTVPMAFPKLKISTNGGEAGDRAASPGEGRSEQPGGLRARAGLVPSADTQHPDSQLC